MKKRHKLPSISEIQIAIGIRVPRKVLTSKVVLLRNLLLIASVGYGICEPE